MTQGSDQQPLRKSYQFAPSSIEGWNDCPILPKSVSSSSLSSNDSRKPSSVRRNRRPVHVSHADYSQQIQSSPQSLSTPPPPPPAISRLPPSRISSATLSRTPSNSISTVSEDFKLATRAKLDALISHSSSLHNDEHALHINNIEIDSLFNSNETIIFINSLLSEWESSGRNINNPVVSRLFSDYLNTHTSAHWLPSLKKLMATIDTN